MDLPAQIYRVGLFHRSGLVLWDSQWYGGHWTLSYSVIFPPVAGVLGMQVTEVLTAAGAAWAFDRLVVASSMSVYGEGLYVGGDGEPTPPVERRHDRLQQKGQHERQRERHKDRSGPIERGNDQHNTL